MTICVNAAEVRQMSGKIGKFCLGGTFEYSIAYMITQQETSSRSFFHSWLLSYHAFT